MNDRELLMQWQQEQKASEHVIDHLLHYEVLAAGLARFCHQFLAALLEPGTISRDEALQLLAAAIQGR